MRSCLSRSICSYAASLTPFPSAIAVSARHMHSSAALLGTQAPESTESGLPFKPTEQPRAVHRRRHFQPKAPRRPRLFPSVYTHAKPTDTSHPTDTSKPIDTSHKTRPSPWIADQGDTHTLKFQPTNIRLQFQQEPASRTKLQQKGANARIEDYKQAQAYSTAPWPTFREIVINRPESLHSLDIGLIFLLDQLYMAMDHNPDITAVVLRPQHAHPAVKAYKYTKSFCNGMDVQTIMSMVEEAKNPTNEEDQSKKQKLWQGTPLGKYFRSLYTMAFNLSKTRTHLVAVLDGLTTGAGAFALQARYRVATENTQISFPQVQHGWFPDAGASYILSRLDGHMGMMLALTGWPVSHFEAVTLGLATHYIHSSDVHLFGERIGGAGLTAQFAEDTVEQVFGMFDMPQGSNLSFAGVPYHRLVELVERVFAVESVEEIFLKLQQQLAPPRPAHVSEAEAATEGKTYGESDPAARSFYEQVLTRMLSASPSSLKYTFRLLHLSTVLPLENCLQLEYRLAQRLLARADEPWNSELILAPNWKQTNLRSVTNEQIDAIFEQDEYIKNELILEYPGRKKETWWV